MSNKYLGRDDAPFGLDVWDVLDQSMIKAAKSQLVGRRLLEIEGPFGLGLKSIPLDDREVEPGLFASASMPLMLIQQTFALPTRDLASYERQPLTLSTTPLVEAAMACATQEERLVFHGAGDAPGLLNADGVKAMDLSEWDEVGAAANDVIGAVTTLDEAGVHGPYALALAPQRYNLLFRRYERGNASEMEHVKTMVTEGVFKAPILESGGVLLATGRRFASIVLGQDMTIGLIGPAGDAVEFTISESLALRLREPASVCVLNG